MTHELPRDTSLTVADQHTQTELMNSPVDEYPSSSLKALQETLRKKSVNTLAKFSSPQVIGIGGTGTVMSATEETLGREVAVKILKSTVKDKRKAVERFIREARATAQIEHPNIVPIHEIGILDDAGIYFTMKKVKGQTLREIIDKIKSGNSDYLKDYPRSRLLEIFIDVCQGIAFAHSKGVIHRDIKPENIMVGGYGEVLIMDWGLVKFIDQKNAEPHDTVSITNDANAPELTMDGSISGTPLYMSPEQAAGKTADIDRKTDIYSLGVMLYTILTLALSPFENNASVQDILNSVVSNNFIPPRRRAPHRKIPRELEAICLKAMSLDKHDRYENPSEIIKDIKNFSTGFPVSAYKDPFYKKFWKFVARHPVSSVSTTAVILAIITISSAMLISMYMKYSFILETALPYRNKADAELANAKKIFLELDKINAHNFFKEKTPEQNTLEERLYKSEAIIDNNYNTALMLYNQIPGLFSDTGKVRDSFRSIMTNRINYSLLTRNYDDTSKWLDLLKLWFGKDFEDLSNKELKNIISVLQDKVRGDSLLSLAIPDVQASVDIFKLVEQEDGRISPEKFAENRKTPLSEFVLPQGSYLVSIIPADGRTAVQYPLAVDKNERISLTVPIPDKIPDGMVYIPAGRFLAGGDADRVYRLHPVWLNAFFIKKFEVTFKEYLEFWNQLSNPIEKKKYRAVVQLEKVHTFLDAWDHEGKLIPQFKPELPVVGISHEAAEAYCAWLSKKLNVKCRLPSAMEWEKTARGADGRNFVWGNGYKPEYAFTLGNTEIHKKYPFFAPPGTVPYDISVFGVHDLAGNVREMTSSYFTDESHSFQVKGASASTTRRFLYCVYSSDTPVIPTDIGFRYLIEFDSAQ